LWHACPLIIFIQGLGLALGLAKIYRIDSGEDIGESILKLAAKDKVRTARVEAIGGVREVTLAYFNHETKKYENHRFADENLEVTSLLGNITIKDGKPFLHLHGTFGKSDMSAVTGHLVSGVVHPFLELVMTPTTNRARRVFDPKLGLNAIRTTE
jgi:predicted DNA-binding protein with PD1-like motif